MHVIIGEIAPIMIAVSAVADTGKVLSAGLTDVIVRLCVVLGFPVLVGAGQIEAADVAEGIFIRSVGMGLPDLVAANGTSEPVRRDVPAFAVPGILVYEAVADVANLFAPGNVMGLSLWLRIIAEVTFPVVLVLLCTIEIAVKAVRHRTFNSLSAGGAGMIVRLCVVLGFTGLVGAGQIEAADVAEGIFILSVGMLLPDRVVANGANELVIRGVPGFAVPGILVYGVTAVGANLFAIGNSMGFALRLIIVAAGTLRIVLVSLPVIGSVCKAVRLLAVAVHDLIAGDADGIVRLHVVLYFLFLVGAGQIEAAEVAESIFIRSVGMFLPDRVAANGTNVLVIRGVPGFAVPDI